MSVHIDQAALGRAVSRQASAGTLKAAVAIATKVRGQGLKVSDGGGGDDETDLPVRVYRDTVKGTATVALTHPAGVAMQARHGALTKAAAAAGFEVHG